MEKEDMNSGWRLHRGEGMRMAGNGNFWWVLLFAVGTGIFFVGMPKYCDDWWYMERFRAWFEGQGVRYPTDGGSFFKAGIPWNEIWETWKAHIMGDNSRLCNIGVVPFLLLPKWVGSLLALCCWMYAMWASWKLAGVNWLKSAVVPLSLAMWAFLMPWREQMGALDYQFNYPVSSALAAGLLLMLERTWLKRGGWGLFVFAVIVGAWQEAFSLPIAFGLGVLWVCHADCRNGRMLKVIVGLGIGLLWLAAAPGLRCRIANEVGRDPFTLYRFYYSFQQHIPFIIFAVATVIVGVRRGWRGVWRDRKLVFLLCSSLLPIFLAFASNAMRRTGWWSDMASIIGVMWLINKYVAEPKGGMRKVVTVLNVALMAITAVHFAYVGYYTVKIAEGYRKNIQEHFAHPGKEVWDKIETEVSAPLICASKPDFTIYTYNWNMVSVNLYYYGRKRTGRFPFRVVPEELRRVTSATGRKIEGDAGMREYKGYLLMPSNGDGSQSFYADIDFGIFKRNRVSMHMYEFESAADGRKYRVVYPEDAAMERRLGEIREVRIVE